MLTHRSSPPHLRAEFKFIYKDLADLGIQHGDIRHANILHAPNGRDALPGLISRYGKRTYKWCTTDFENSEKSNWPGRSSLLTPYVFGDFRGILEGLPQNFILEPWDT